MARFFNPSKYFIILVDQRGSGQSLSLGELRENTTQNLVDDFEKLRIFLNIEKWILFGGSWGTTLSLVYAIQYPNIIKSLILRGVFFASQEEIDWIFEKHGVDCFNPIIWDFYQSLFPTSNNLLKSYYNCSINNNEYQNKNNKDECLFRFNLLETSISSLKFKEMNELLEEYKTKKYKEKTMIEMYYLYNKCFLEKNYILNNLYKIQNISVYIVNGKYDLVTPPKTSYLLYKNLKNASYKETLAGHSLFDENNVKELVKIMDSI